MNHLRNLTALAYVVLLAISLSSCLPNEKIVKQADLKELSFFFQGNSYTLPSATEDDYRNNQLDNKAYCVLSRNKDSLYVFANTLIGFNRYNLKLVMPFRVNNALTSSFSFVSYSAVSYPRCSYFMDINAYNDFLIANPNGNRFWTSGGSLNVTSMSLTGNTLSADFSLYQSFVSSVGGNVSDGKLTNVLLIQQ